MSDEPKESTAVSCPECGGDVCVLRDTKKHWSHRSRLIGISVWSTLILGLLAFWFTTDSLEKFQESTSVRRTVGSEFRLQLLSVQDTELPHQGCITLDDIQGAKNHDPAFIERVQRAFETLIEQADDPFGSIGLQGVKFGFQDSAGYIRSEQSYRLFGKWITITRGWNVFDIRFDEPIELNTTTSAWKARYWRYFPYLQRSIDITDTNSGDVLNRSLDVHYLNILSVYLVLLLISWGVIFALRKIRRKSTASFLPTMILSVSLFVCCAFIVSLIPETYVSRSIRSSPETELTNVLSIEEIKSIVQEPERISLWSAELLELESKRESEDTESVLLAGQVWMFDDSPNAIPHTIDMLIYRASIDYEVPVIQLGRYKFPEQTTEALKSDVNQNFVNNAFQELLESGQVPVVVRNPPEFTILHLSVFGFTLLGFLLWTLWVMIRSMSRFIMGRIQKRRVRRDQCIFCRYPLTEEGRNARSAAETT